MQAAYFAEHVLDSGTEVSAYLLSADVDMNLSDGYRPAPVDRHEGEMKLVLDLQTIRLLQHHPGTVMVQCDVVELDETPVPESPRAILKHQLAAAGNRGYSVVGGTELEFMVFHTSYEDAWNTHYRDLAPVSQYNVDYSIMSVGAGSNRCCMQSAIRCTPQGSTSNRSRQSEARGSMKSACAMGTR